MAREDKEGQKENYLIDIEAIKAGKAGVDGKTGNRRKKGNQSKSKNQYKSIEDPSEVYGPHLCCRKPSKNSIFNIDQLINDSLIK